MGWKVILVILVVIGLGVWGGIVLFGDDENTSNTEEEGLVEETTPTRVQTEQEKLEATSGQVDENGTTKKKERRVILTINETINEALLSREDDRLNLGESLLNVTGPKIFEATLNKFLKKKTIRSTYTGKSISYEQKIEFSNISTLEEFEDRDYINTSDEYVGFVLEPNEQMLNYTISFVERATWQDLEGMMLQVLGRQYYVVGNLGNFPRFRLFDEPYIFDLEEGEIVTIQHPSLGKQVFEIARVDPNGVRLFVNGNETIEYEEGSDYLEQNMLIYVEDVSYVETKTSRIRIAISPRILELAREEVTLGGQVLEGIEVEYYPLGDEENLDEMTISWEIEEKTFVTADRPLTLPYFNNLEFSMIDTTYELSGKLYTNVTLTTKIYEMKENIIES